MAKVLPPKSPTYSKPAPLPKTSATKHLDSTMPVRVNPKQMGNHANQMGAAAKRLKQLNPDPNSDDLDDDGD